MTVARMFEKAGDFGTFLITTEDGFLLIVYILIIIFSVFMYFWN